MDASVWIGPAIVAAVISTIGGVITLFFSHRRVIKLDTRRREERIRDVQTALRAEIRSNWLRLSAIDPEKHAEHVTARMSADNGSGKTFTPFVPREGQRFVFTAIVKEIQILPTEVIDPIVLYYDQIFLISQFVDDLRSEQFDALEADRKVEMYRDYIAMLVQAAELAALAIDAINTSLDRGRPQ